MVEGEATQEPSAPEGASASPSEETPVEIHESAPPPPEETEEVVVGVAAQAAPALDWSHLRGFQTVEPPGEAIAARSDYAEELGKELATRATRFTNAVDESIVLSSDALMRWLGDPVARVVAGEALLAPRAVLLADDSLAGEERVKVETRVALWLGAHVRKVLGPLVALADGADLPEPARLLGGKIAEALGVLERERVRNDAKALDQTARGGLRKLGVRFGSHYIYVPVLLKPAARGLCSLLWTLRRGSETGAERLLAFAAAGRTSFANEGLLSPDAYRVAGFRLCGERVVRVDIIERLSDLIRAAIPDHMRSGSRPTSDAYGFAITAQMTSLTGCSGEAFASILRSLGFEAVKVNKAAFEAAHRRAPTEPIKPPTPEDTAPTESATSPESATEPSPEPSALESAESTPELSEDATAEGAIEPVAAVDFASAPPEETVTGEPTSEPSTTETISAEAEPHPEVEGEETEEKVEASSPEPSAAPESETLAAPSSEESESGEAEALASTPGDVEPAMTSDASAETAAAADPGSEEVEIWRPAPRRPRPPQRPQGAVRDESPQAGKNREHRRRGRPEPRTPAEPAVAAEGAPSAADPPARGVIEGRNEEQRRREHKGKDDQRPREDRRPSRDFGPRRESRPTQVDPDSPFAKLAALKPLLERRDKRP